MRISRKFALALITGLVLVGGVYGAASYRLESDEIAADLQRDHRLIARSLRAPAAEAWGSGGAPAVLALIHDVDRELPKVHVHWIADGQPLAFPPNPEELASLAQGRVVSRTDPADEHLVSWVSVPRGGGTLQIEESLQNEKAMARTRWIEIGATGASLAIADLLVTMGLGYWLVARPSQRLVAHAARVSGGDFDSRTQVTTDDELGEVGRAMDAMAVELGVLRARLLTEQADRLRALEHLRHAERLTTVGTLAAGLAHELGTPLNVIGGRAQLIAQDSSEETVRNGARIIHDQTQRLTALVRRVLDFARPRAASVEDQPIGLVVQRTVAFIEPLARSRGVTLLAEIGDDVRAAIDGDLVQQALTNLIVNATHATPDGGTVRVGLAREERAAPIDLGGKVGRFARIWVMDEGAGVPDDVAPRLFEPFFTTKGVGEGTGLGLSITWGIARELGGWLDFESPPGAGATFSIHLPLPEVA